MKSRIAEYNRAHQESITQNNTEAFQVFLKKDVDKNVNDLYTKSAAYYIIYSYFTNGGNIYEVYNYIESHPELSFLKEAENLYPEMFEYVKNKRLPFTYSDQGMYASLAYFEILDKYGYVDIATLGTLSGQYAKMAYYKRMILEDKKKGLNLDYPNYTEEQVQHDISKSVFFTVKSKDIILKIINSTEKNEKLLENDVLIGVTQFASALRYLQAMNVDIPFLISAKEIFSFAMVYSYSFAPSLYLSTSLANASTLLLLSSTTSNELRNAIYPFLTYDSKVNNPTGIVNRILQAKYEVHISRFADLNIYSKINIISLAKKVPEFKEWLMSNGWVESDFK